MQNESKTTQSRKQEIESLIKTATTKFDDFAVQSNRHALFENFVKMTCYAYARERYEERYLNCVEEIGNKAARELMPDMLSTALQIAQLQIEIRGWADPFGLLFERLGLSNKRNAQYFTPFEVCDMTAKATIAAKTDEHVTVNDPAVGSGRPLLAATTRAPNAVLLGSDIAPIACWMFTANLAIQGFSGEVACIDYLNQKYYWHTRVNWPAPIHYKQTKLYRHGAWGVELYDNSNQCSQYLKLVSDPPKPSSHLQTPLHQATTEEPPKQTSLF